MIPTSYVHHIYAGVGAIRILSVLVKVEGVRLLISLVWPSFLFALTELDNTLILLAVMRHVRFLPIGLIFFWLVLLASFRAFFLHEMRPYLSDTNIRVILASYLIIVSYRLFRDGFQKNAHPRQTPSRSSFWIRMGRLVSLTILLLVLDTSLGFDQMATSALLYHDPLQMFLNVFLSKTLALAVILFLPKTIMDHPWVSLLSAILIAFTGTYVLLADHLSPSITFLTGTTLTGLIMFFSWWTERKRNAH